MKTTLLTLALVATAGVASAQTASTPATGAGATMNNSTITNGNTGMQGAQMGVGTQSQMNGNVQSPATGQMNGQMNGTMNAPAAQPARRPTRASPTHRRRPMTGAAHTAQKRIEQDGYKSVQNLQRGSDGLWHGTAMRGNTSVQVTVDRTGRRLGAVSSITHADFQKPVSPCGEAGFLLPASCRFAASLQSLQDEVLRENRMPDASTTTNSDHRHARAHEGDLRRLQQPRRRSHRLVLHRRRHLLAGARARAGRPHARRQGDDPQDAGRPLQGDPRHALGPQGVHLRRQPGDLGLDREGQGRRRART